MVLVSVQLFWGIMRLIKVNAIALAWAVRAVSAMTCVALSMTAAEAQGGLAPVLDANVAPRATPASLKQIAAQRRHLMAIMMADPSNLDIAFEYASLSAAAGDLEGAISTLERMLIFAPGLPRLDLELGVLYYRLGAYDSALSYFQAALAPENKAPPEVRTKVNAYIAAIGKHTQPNQFEGAVSFGAQYQTNANGGPSSLDVELNGLPFVLSQSAASTPDANAYAAGSFRYSKDLSSQGDRFLVGLQTYGSLYRQQWQLNTLASELTFGPELNLQRFHVDDATLGVYGSRHHQRIVQRRAIFPAPGDVFALVQLHQQLELFGVELVVIPQAETEQRE